MERAALRPELNQPAGTGFSTVRELIGLPEGVLETEIERLEESRAMAYHALRLLGSGSPEAYSRALSALPEQLRENWLRAAIGKGAID